MNSSGQKKNAQMVCRLFFEAIPNASNWDWNILPKIIG